MEEGQQQAFSVWRGALDPDFEDPVLYAHAVGRDLLPHTRALPSEHVELPGVDRADEPLSIQAARSQAASCMGTGVVDRKESGSRTRELSSLDCAVAASVSRDSTPARQSR